VRDLVEDKKVQWDVRVIGYPDVRMKLSPVLVKLVYMYFSRFFRCAFEDVEVLDEIVFQSFFVV
jgi:hypothetical protein